jgi:hypothetical protein
MRSILTIALGATVGCLCALPSVADVCQSPAAPIVFPEPSTASERDILAAQDSVKQYLTDMEVVLKCMDAAHNDRARNLAVDDMRMVAAKFNTILRAYRARQQT